MKRVIAACVLAGMLTSFGCGQSSSGQVRIAVIPKALTHQFWLTVKTGAETAGKDLGVAVTWMGPDKETQVDKQVDIIETMIVRGVNAIVLAACDENALNGPIQRALDAGIPVITMDSGVTSDLPLSFVATDNIAGAKAAARELARLIGEEGEVGLIPFVYGAATSQMREEGFKEGIKEFPNIRLVSVQYCDSNEAKAMSVTQDMLTAHPNIKGIFAANESACIGAAQALKTLGKAGQVKLVGFDAADEEVAALRDGAVQALIVQDPFKMGYLSVQTAMDAIKGQPVEKRIDTGVKVVTLDNLETPEIQKLLKPL